MKTRDKERMRRLARNEREARKKVINKRKKCKHSTCKHLEQGLRECVDCGLKIRNISR